MVGKGRSRSTCRIPPLVPIRRRHPRALLRQAHRAAPCSSAAPVCPTRLFPRDFCSCPPPLTTDAVVCEAHQQFMVVGFGRGCWRDGSLRFRRMSASGGFPNPLDSGRPTPNLPKRASQRRAVTRTWCGGPPTRHISSRHTAAPQRVRAKTGIARRSPPHASRSHCSAPAANLCRQTQLRERFDREQQHRGRPTGIRIQICSLEESRLFRYTMGPLVSPARLELARKSTRLNSSHLVISYAVFCLKKNEQLSDIQKIQHGGIETRLRDLRVLLA